MKFPGAAETPRAKRSASAIEGVRYRAQPGDRFIGLPGQTVDDYWAWAYGNLVGNTNRGVLAEYIVGAALDALTPHREVWAAFDHLYRGHGIEVKASAYLQAWEQSRLSTIRFGIAPHWPDNTDKATVNERVHHADCYVFCLLTTTDPEAVNPLDLSQWEFYVMPTGAVPEGARSASAASNRSRARSTGVGSVRPSTVRSSSSQRVRLSLLETQGGSRHPEDPD